MSESVYRDHAEHYGRFTETSVPNEHYDRPAILRLAAGPTGDLTGRRVLELGCASGVLTLHLVERGADVLALDREPRMVAQTRERVGDRARVAVADLEQPLDVATGSVDVVVASLVLHYLADWAPLLAELHRVLVPGGSLVFSIHHPITGWQVSDRGDYHRTELIREDWIWDGLRVTAEMWRRPLSAVLGSLREAGFALDVVDEPQPVDVPPGTAPELVDLLRTKPVFLFVRAVASTGPRLPG